MEFNLRFLGLCLLAFLCGVAASVAADPVYERLVNDYWLPTKVEINQEPIHEPLE